MTQVVSATYNSTMQAVNAYDELISMDFPREKVFFDKDANVVKVIVPDPGQREAQEMLNRHEPVDVQITPYEE
ncbi:hypothetical protein HVA01_12810 [Halovibrio variabilis]|uniref:DUF2007 domain-containing protein n=1 Tax=Halovibrio variabilis TaxID=31910 RepID=A0A511ULY2_9GAMM|nr:hypothetical protein [Halovibrio variabilis]GEN27635.1 hypothetical protein HVA01_12810 [Halovibrio variabilis]